MSEKEKLSDRFYGGLPGLISLGLIVAVGIVTIALVYYEDYNSAIYGLLAEIFLITFHEWSGRKD